MLDSGADVSVLPEWQVAVLQPPPPCFKLTRPIQLFHYYQKDDGQVCHDLDRIDEFALLSLTMFDMTFVAPFHIHKRPLSRGLLGRDVMRIAAVAPFSEQSIVFVRLLGSYADNPCPLSEEHRKFEERLRNERGYDLADRLAKEYVGRQGVATFSYKSLNELHQPPYRIEEGIELQPYEHLLYPLAQLVLVPDQPVLARFTTKFYKFRYDHLSDSWR
jgi:hypothetical protein